MRKFLFIVFIFPCLLFGQNTTIDSLNLVLKNAKHDTIRCNILNLLIESEGDETVWVPYNDQLQLISEKNIPLFRTGHPLNTFFSKHLASSFNNQGTIFNYAGNNEKALEMYNKALKIQTAINDTKGIAASLNNLGYLYVNIGEIPKGLGYFHKALFLQKEVKDYFTMAYILNNIGAIEESLGNNVVAISYLEKALKLREALDDKAGIAQTLINMGIIYYDNGDVQKALDCDHKSYKLYEQIKDKRGLAKSLNNMATIYADQGELDKSLDDSNIALKYCEELGDKTETADLLHNIAWIYEQKGETQKAMDNYYKSMKIMEELKNPRGVSQTLANIANILYNNNELNKASEFFTRSLKLKEELGDKEGQARLLNNIGALMFKNGNSKDGLIFAEKGMAFAVKIGFPENIRNSAITLKDIYKKTHKPELALKMFEIYVQMKDSLNNLETRKISLKKQFQVEFEGKEKEVKLIAAAEKQIMQEKSNEEAKHHRFIIYSIIFGLILVCIFTVFIFRSLQKNKKANIIITNQKFEVEQQKHIIEEKHREITDSINYAERIQRSFIATKEILDQNLKEYFVLFKPKDVVSGDFYWAGKLNNGNFALVTADSTGHGVPGAIMSLLNITSLEKAIETLTQPSDILNATRKTIIERLKKDGSEHGGKDGMDASLTAYDFNNNRLIIAAANNPIWIVRGTETIDIKPDKMPIGKHDKDAVSFTQQEIDLQKGDVVYTLSDGFPDQFGGEKGKKFMSKNLRELLSANAHLPMHEQKLLLEKTFADWVGNLEQVDDVTLIGVRI